jgi:Spy/CpxP family protein refolding chaperone
MTRRYRAGWASAVALAVLLATFVAGGLIGGAVVRILDAGEPAPVQEPPTGRGLVFSGEGPLSDRLDLTPQQRLEIERIVLENRRKAAMLMRDMQPVLRARYDSTVVAIEAVLTPEQRAEFQQIRSEERDRIRIRFRGEWGEPPGDLRRPPHADTAR